MNMTDIETIKKLLEGNVKVTIIPHRNPDGDAMGSCLGLYHLLKIKQINAKVIAPNDFPDFLSWLPKSEDVLIFENEPQKATQYIEESDIIFTLDFNALSRVGQPFTQVLEKSTAFFVMIDHHQAPEDYAMVQLSLTQVSSTCELIYNFITALGFQNLINKDIATCLYTGIMTDTGGFRYRNTNEHTHRIVATLIEQNIDVTQIASDVFDSFTPNRLQLLGNALENLVFVPTLQTSYIALTTAQLKACNFQKGDTDGFVNYGLKIKEANLSAIFIENDKEGIVKISFRSKGNLDVNTFARLHFNGGGHINAAGGSSTDTLENTITKFLTVLPEYLQQTNS